MKEKNDKKTTHKLKCNLLAKLNMPIYFNSSNTYLSSELENGKYDFVGQNSMALNMIQCEINFNVENMK